MSRLPRPIRLDAVAAVHRAPVVGAAHEHELARREVDRDLVTPER